LAVARTIRIDPRGGPVTVFGDLLDPSGLGMPLKIDLWRKVRHPPPELVHAKTLKKPQEPVDYTPVPHPAGLIGKVVTWTWNLAGLPNEISAWRIVVDVRQGKASIDGYPVEYRGEFEAGTRYDELKVSESVEDHRGPLGNVGSYQMVKGQ
jgi:hypothetical protein